MTGPAALPRVSPPKTLGATFRVEYLMQLRKLSMLVIVAVTGLLTSVTVDFGDRHGKTTSQLVGGAALRMNLIVPVVAGCFLADRLIRDYRLGVIDVLDATPARPLVRLWGKYLGATAAVITPVAVLFALQVARVVAARHDLVAVPVGAAAFLTVILPGMLFVAAFSIGMPRLLGAPLYRALFFGYWVWGNQIDTGAIPTISRTWLTPIGGYAAAGLFKYTDPGLPSSHHTVGQGATAVGSIALLLVSAAMALGALGLFERRRRATN